MNPMPDTLTVILVNEHPKIAGLEHMNENYPLQFRTVQIKLTDEQMKQIAPRMVGENGGKPCFELFYNAWMEGGNNG